MGRKAKRLRSRMRLIEQKAQKERVAVAEALLRARMREQEAERVKRSAEALSIRLEEFERGFGDVLGLRVTFHPEMFFHAHSFRDFKHPSGFHDVSGYCRMIAGDVAEKVEHALMDWWKGKFEGQRA